VTRKDHQRLRDLLDRITAAKAAENLLEQAQDSGNADLARTAFDAVLYDLLVIGEAAKALPPALRTSRPEVPWSDITKMRDVLAHHYYKVRVDVVRATLDAPLEALRQACVELLHAGD
jgi:uncharacterized protein with HEPN domain